MLLRIHCHLAATVTSRSAYPEIALRGDDCRHIVYRLTIAAEGVGGGTVQFLSEWKGQQAQELEIQGIDQKDEMPVCTSTTYGLLDPNTFSRWRRDFFVKHDLGHYETVTQFMPNVGREVKKQVYVGLNFHELRHTQATLLI